MISVIIPTLNEEKSIANCIKSFDNQDCEIIVVDAESKDNTVSIAKSMGVKVIISTIANRAIQMNLGAKQADGEVFLFFHADSRIPKDGLQAITYILENKKIVGGGFNLDFYPKTAFYSFIGLTANIFCRITNLVFGDRGIFIRKKDFWALGGYPEKTIMEDAAFTDMMRKKGRLVILSQTVLTSARKYFNETKLQWFYRTSGSYIAYRIGIPPEKIYRFYYGLK